MAVLTVQDATRAGVTPTWNTAAAGGDSFANDGKVIAIVKNSGTEKTLTIPLVETVDGQTPASKTVTIPATTGEKLIGPFPTIVYNDANGRVNFTYSLETGVTVGVFRVP